MPLGDSGKLFLTAPQKARPSALPFLGMGGAGRRDIRFPLQSIL